MNLTTLRIGREEIINEPLTTDRRSNVISRFSLVGNHPKFNSCLGDRTQCSRHQNYPVLISGETGSGKKGTRWIYSSKLCHGRMLDLKSWTVALIPDC